MAGRARRLALGCQQRGGRRAAGQGAGAGGDAVTVTAPLLHRYSAVMACPGRAPSTGVGRFPDTRRCRTPGASLQRILDTPAHWPRVRLVVVHPPLADGLFTPTGGTHRRSSLPRGFPGPGVTPGHARSRPVTRLHHGKGVSETDLARPGVTPGLAATSPESRVCTAVELARRSNGSGRWFAGWFAWKVPSTG